MATLEGCDERSNYCRFRRALRARCDATAYNRTPDSASHGATADPNMMIHVDAIRTAHAGISQPLPARLPSRRLLRMGRCGEPARRDLRPRRGPQWPRLRRARRGAGADASRARRRHARPRQLRLARRPERLRVPHLSHHADGADRAQRRGRRRLGRHVDGRAAGDRRWPRSRRRRSAAWSSTTSGRRSSRRRWRASAATSARTRRSPPLPRSKRISAKFRRRSAR